MAANNKKRKNAHTHADGTVPCRTQPGQQAGPRGAPRLPRARKRRRFGRRRPLRAPSKTTLNPRRRLARRRRLGNTVRYVLPSLYRALSLSHSHTHTYFFGGHNCSYPHSHTHRCPPLHPRAPRLAQASLPHPRRSNTRDERGEGGWANRPTSLSFLQKKPRLYEKTKQNKQIGKQNKREWGRLEERIHAKKRVDGTPPICLFFLIHTVAAHSSHPPPPFRMLCCDTHIPTFFVKSPFHSLHITDCSLRSF